MRYNPISGTINNYSADDGLQSNDFFFNACCYGMDGEMIFGGSEGYNRFNPEMITDNPQVPNVVITRVKVLDRIVKSEMTDGDTLEVRYADNMLTFEFSALDFTEPKKSLYAFMLEGFNKDWIENGVNRIATFTNLNPGTYILRVRASNNEGVWNRKGMAVVIHVMPPLYMTAWFKWSTGIIGILLLFLLWDRRIKHVRKKEREKRHQIESELQALRLQMNPHFLFNSLNAIQNFLFNSNEEEANKYLTKFAQLMRMILENSRRPIIPISEELEGLKLYLELETLRYGHRFSYDIRIDPQIDTTRHIPSMLIQPYVENAIRHGLAHKAGNGELVVELQQDEDALHCIIQDNGIGRKKASEIKDRPGIRKESLGMAVTERRLQILNEQRKKPMSVVITDLADEHGEAAGTRVEISIPLE
jgi:hypothetical protein